ncbi:membrane-associating domain-containing protein [Dichotomopilus funicola]|uniref:Membrane-associating domain-containing protein n=1 Tax=Dichotomopilus funicola TaxID=1934379 RepID=A0AAN6V9K8_9PEZI|nr:membrane-associating domain-containing protein [Dichotomopilus funicola]
MMKLTNLSFPLITILRATQGVFAALILILSAFVANWYNTTTPSPSPSQVNFLLFGAVWSMLSLAAIELLPRFLTRIPKPYLTLPLDILNALFYLAGFAALAAFLQGLLFCRGDVCHAAQADVAFGAFSFAVWTATAVLSGKEALRVRRTGGIGSGAAQGPLAGTGAMPGQRGMKEAV